MQGTLPNHTYTFLPWASLHTDRLAYLAYTEGMKMSLVLCCALQLGGHTGNG